MKTVMIDMDGVLVDFTAAFTRHARGIDPEQPIVSTLHQPCWNLTGSMQPELIGKTWKSISETPDWWVNEPWPLFTDAERELLIDMRHEYDLVFVTSRKAGKHIAQQTIAWLEMRGLEKPSVLVCKNKGEIAKAIHASYAIEDRPENAAVIHWLTEGQCQSYLIDRLYNQTYPLPSAVVRVKSLEEFFNQIRT